MADADKKIWEMAREIGESLGYEVDDIEILGQGRRTLLRVTIDKPSGVGVDDCADFSRDFSALMDVEDPIKASYTLEVSSPGLDRPLKRPEHYMKNTGKLAKVVLKEQVDGRSFIKGRIVSASGQGLVIEDAGENIEVGYANVRRARLEAEI